MDDLDCMNTFYSMAPFFFSTAVFAVQEFLFLIACFPPPPTNPLLPSKRQYSVHYLPMMFGTPVIHGL